VQSSAGCPDPAGALEALSPGATLGSSLGEADKAGSSLELGLSPADASTVVPDGWVDATAGDELLGVPHEATNARHRATAAPWRL
jgi:hypothetical protein